LVKSNGTVALVLACDLTPEGELGTHTIARLERGLLWHKENPAATLVVTAGNSPYHPLLSITMAELMLEWLVRRHCYRVKVGLAPTFDTRGELLALQQIEAIRYVIISAWWHIPRVRLIARQVFGSSASLEFVSAWSDRPTLKQLVLELPKYIHIMLPISYRAKARALWEKMFGRASW